MCLASIAAHVSHLEVRPKCLPLTPPKIYKSCSFDSGMASTAEYTYSTVYTAVHEIHHLSCLD